MNPSTQSPLDRATFPGVPESVADLWSASPYDGSLEPASVRAVLNGASAVVNAMAGGTRYAVTLSGATATAATAYKQRQVLITTAALQDQRLSVLERLGITTALAVHEAGHGRLSEPMGQAVERWAKSTPMDSATKFLVAKFSNVIEDVRLERLSDERWPAYRGLFPLAMWWVAQRYPSGGVSRMPTTKGEALNLCIAATRYDEHTAWSADPAVQDERAWWIAWAERGAQEHKPAGHIRVIREALEHISALPANAPDSEHGTEPGDGQGESGEAGDGEQGEPGGEAGDGQGSAPCTCGCSVAQFAPVKAGCTDEHCQCHGGQQPDEDGDEPGNGSGGEADEDGDEDEDGSGTGASGLDADEDGDPGEDAEGDGGDGAIDGDGEGDATGEKPGETGADKPGSGAGNGGEADRDALDEPLPLELDEPGALSADEQAIDQTVVDGLNSEAQALSRTEIAVTHPPVNDPGWDQHRQTVAVIDEPNPAHIGTVTTSPMVQAALRQAFSARKTSHEAKTMANSGQVSGRRLYRARTGVGQVFTRREGNSPDRLDVHFVVDCSSSMAGGTIMQAQSLTANMVEALARIPTIRTHVWGFRSSGMSTALLDVFDSRKGHKVNRLSALFAAGGTPTATAVRAIGQRVLQDRKPRERSLIVVLTDGQPSEHEQWVRSAVETMGKQRVGVLAVAIAPGLSESQRRTFGADSTVIWNGDWRRLGRDLGKALGRLA